MLRARPESFSTAPARPSLDRVTRLFALFVGVGYVGYLALLSGQIIAYVPHVAQWWTPTMAGIVFIPGLALGLVTRLPDARAMKVLGAAAAVTFLVAVATWPWAWNGTTVPQNEGVWLAAFPGLASLAAVVAWPAWLAVAHMVIGCVSVQVVNFYARGADDPGALMPEILFAIMFCSVFVGGAVMALRTGRILDETTQATHENAAAAAAQQARGVERERFGALVHDSVMSTLLTASRGGSHDDVAAAARAALSELDEIRAGVEADQPFDPSRAVVHLRAAAAEADTGAAFEVVARGPDGEPIPADAVRAIGAALAEALRNSARHAGAGANRAVRGVVDLQQMQVDVRDDGRGFDPDGVPPQRLGIAVSIRGRMSRLSGGSASVESAPGSGTLIRLEWVRS